MYVLVIENQSKRHSGYLVIHDKREYIETEQGDSLFSDGEDYYIETPDKSNCFMKIDFNIKNQPQRVNLYPFGSIAVQWYNRQVDECLNRGGKIAPLWISHLKSILNRHTDRVGCLTFQLRVI